MAYICGILGEIIEYKKVTGKNYGNLNKLCTAVNNNVVH